jgi:hypothetical protein
LEAYHPHLLTTTQSRPTNTDFGLISTWQLLKVRLKGACLDDGIIPFLIPLRCTNNILSDCPEGNPRRLAAISGILEGGGDDP